MADPGQIKIPLYGRAVHDCVARGDLAAMKRVRDEAEVHLAEHGDLRAALEILNAEIVKAESRGA